jgi:hypothetical protein
VPSPSTGGLVCCLGAQSRLLLEAVRVRPRKEERKVQRRRSKPLRLRKTSEQSVRRQGGAARRVRAVQEASPSACVLRAVAGTQRLREPLLWFFTSAMDGSHWDLSCRELAESWEP